MELLNGFIATDKEKIKMAQTFNANKLQILTKIVIPSNIPTFFNTLKVNIGLTLVGVISGEFLVSKGGLGYLIVYGGQVFQLDLVMTSVIILAFLAAFLALLASSALFIIILAPSGFSIKNLSNPSENTLSANFLTSELPSLPFV